jgi:hypothetical protein
LAKDNVYERAIDGISTSFKTGVDALKPQLRGGKTPPFTEKVTKSMLRDPYFAEKLAQNYESQGLHAEAEYVRQQASGINTFPHGDNSRVPAISETEYMPGDPPMGPPQPSGDRYGANPMDFGTLRPPGGSI